MLRPKIIELDTMSKDDLIIIGHPEIVEKIKTVLIKLEISEDKKAIKPTTIINTPCPLCDNPVAFYSVPSVVLREAG